MQKSLKFSLIGAGGYIAPRHLKAIKDTGNILVAAVDTADSVGILDSHFFGAEFFNKYKEYEAYIKGLHLSGSKKRIEYTSICTPNYLHEAQIISALRVGSNVICEKPLVLTDQSLGKIIHFEKKYGQGKVNTILQLRLHPVLQKLREKVMNEKSKSLYDIDLTYIVPRGKWYFKSWKGHEDLSGGLVSNIGIHFFDMLIWIFGEVKKVSIYKSTPKVVSGFLNLKKANVRWYLSLDRRDLPEPNKAENKSYRSLTLNGIEFPFSDGFTDLHTEIYKNVLGGNGFTPEDVRPSIQCVETIRNAPIIFADIDSKHPYLLKHRK